MISRVLLVSTFACAVFAAQATRSQIVSTPAPAEGDVFAYYTEHVHPLPSGVYEWNGWVFFHDRTPMEESGFFRKQASQAESLSRVEQSIFEKISSLMTGAAIASNNDVYATIPGSWFSEHEEAVRSIRALPSRILSRTDEDGVFVFDMAIRLSDLQAEASKGTFKSRPDAHARQWKEAVTSSLTSADRMAFFRDTGALDLWTLLSEKTSGTVAIAETAEPSLEDCRRAIEALRSSVQGTSGDAAAEYDALLKSLFDDMLLETNSIPEVFADGRIKAMVLSFAACPLPPAKFPAESAKLFADCLKAPADDAGARAQLCNLLAKAPGSSIVWCGLSAKMREVGAPHIALSCARNALRCALGDPLSLDAVRSAYDGLGLSALARDAAAPILALSDDAALRRKAEAQLQRSQP